MNGSFTDDRGVHISGGDSVVKSNQHPGSDGPGRGGTQKVLREMAQGGDSQENGQLESVSSSGQHISYSDGVPNRGAFWIAYVFIMFAFTFPVLLPGNGLLKILYMSAWCIVGAGVGGFIYMYTPARTPAQELERRQRITLKRKRKKRDKLIKKEAKRLTRQAMAALARIGFARVKENDKGMIKTYSKVRPEAIVCTRDAIGIKISSKTPMGVRFVNMATRDVADDLAIRLQRGVWWEGWREDYEQGLWLFISLNSGTMGITNNFPWYDKIDSFNALEQLPKTKKYALMVGVTRGRKPIYTSLPDLPHMGIFGATNTGKSVFLNQLLCTLIARQTPKQLGLILIDMKRVELADYDGIPHLLRPRVSDMDDVAPTIQWLLDEMDKRYQMIEGTARNIKEWNRANPYRRLKRIALVIDEWAAVMLNKNLTNTERGKIEANLTRIVQEARAVGIHCILSTQVPKRSIMEGLLMANITNRMVFQMGDIKASQIALDTSESARIPDDPGRGIWRSGPSKMDVKAPFITSQQIRDTIKAAIANHDTPPEIDPIELIEWGLTHNGRLSDPVIIDFAKHSGVGVDFARGMVKGCDYDIITKKPVFHVGDQAYIVGMLPGKGRKIIETFPDNLPEKQEEIENLYKTRKAQKKAQDEIVT